LITSLTGVGTIGYMSPEQVRGTASDARSDIFSFGAVLYEMLTGKRASKRDTAAGQGPIGLQRILGRCLEKNVERRFQSASDLAFAIEALSGAATSAAQTVERPKATRAWLP
jgi:serine/threonine protein kinase